MYLAGPVPGKVPLFTVLQKFGGERPTDFVLRKLRCFYRLSKLPPYLILVLNRYSADLYSMGLHAPAAELPPVTPSCPLYPSLRPRPWAAVSVLFCSALSCTAMRRGLTQQHS